MGALCDVSATAPKLLDPNPYHSPQLPYIYILDCYSQRPVAVLHVSPHYSSPSSLFPSSCNDATTTTCNSPSHPRPPTLAVPVGGPLPLPRPPSPRHQSHHLCPNPHLLHPRCTDKLSLPLVVKTTRLSCRSNRRRCAGTQLERVCLQVRERQHKTSCSDGLTAWVRGALRAVAVAHDALGPAFVPCPGSVGRKDASAPHAMHAHAIDALGCHTSSLRLSSPKRLQRLLY